MIQRLSALITAGESQTMEFRASFDKASIESLVAFANTEGGTVLVGVNDRAEVQGVTVGKETLNALALNEIADMYLQSLQISWDAQVAPQASVADLSPAKIERFIPRVNATGRFAVEASTPQAALQQKEISGQLNKVIRALLAEGLIEPTIPDKLNSRLQQYRLTKPR